ncbi:MAG: hypothetical protein KatS3mg102_1199 [Planctomycetota bacterium]|nr:MAG: hypothetical protein KatS3mg102_1199 [Planctomycetota bacterium]
MSVVEPIDERRSALRVEVALRARLHEVPEPGAWPGEQEWTEPLYGRVLNISRTGLLFRSAVPVCPGRRVVVVLRCREGHLPVHGRVVRVARGRGGRHHIGIALEALPQAARRVIARLVESHRVQPELN